ncbi:thermonuclease family protein [Hymenobacter aerophilus]|uniref:thermonuclease family protein n=1 Tax=Hymenobacter aerophilus TaxID=119644 RepID=UPI00036180A6|nr:thermonuclease family protein [Hymenobacter aerophilus]
MEFGSVRRVLDGDTYEVLLPAGLVRVRLLGVDAPELSQPYGRQAADSVGRLLQGRVLEVGRLGVDGYGRTLAGLRVGVAVGPLAGPFVRRWLRVDSLLVARGWAWAYEPGRSVPALAGLQERAQRRYRGLWRCGLVAPVRPAVWRAMNKLEKLRSWGGCS